MDKEIKKGDFTGLASDYTKSRPNYSNTVLSSIIGLLSKPIVEIDFADVGAGTGIWTNMVIAKTPKSSCAVEPNDDMRSEGIKFTKGKNVNWIKGSAENTGIESDSLDWVTMASSFHWTDFDKATKEFHRILKKNGVFTALWNPRLIEVNPLLVEIESHLNVLRPNIERVSSGRSGLTEKLTEKLWCSDFFTDIVYIEGRHVIEMSKERYMSAWRSVNDLRVQLGPEKFELFLDFIKEKIKNEDVIKATYLTRSWSAKRKS